MQNAPKEQNFILAIVHAGVLASAGAYLLAVFFREDGPDGSSNPALAAAQSGAEKQASRFGGFFARTAAKSAQENPQAVAAMAGAAAPSLAAQLFGGASAPAAAPSSDAESGAGHSSNHGFNGAGFNSVAPASGGGLESFKPAGNSAPKGFYDDDDTPAGMFSGNAGYGGSSGGGGGGSPQAAPVKDSAAVSQSKAAKYGVAQAGALGAPMIGGDDLPEDNPFAQ